MPEAGTQAVSGGNRSKTGVFSGPFPTESRAGIFSLLWNSDRLKTGFFRQVRGLKIQRKNPGSALCSAKQPVIGLFWFYNKNQTLNRK